MFIFNFAKYGFKMRAGSDRNGIKFMHKFIDYRVVLSRVNEIIFKYFAEYAYCGGIWESGRASSTSPIIIKERRYGAL